MCGIIGWVGPRKPPFSAETFAAATQLLAHRGPDDQGIWTADGVMLGHRRLSIIDLSAAGHQPMISASGRSHIVYNGEIYNYPELRVDLSAGGLVVPGGSDTAILLELIEAEGVASLSKLNGMFAFALWDQIGRKLWLGRDRFGVKPLYYHHGACGFTFASEPKALLRLHPELRRIDERTLLSFLAYNDLCSSGRSFYDGIRVLPPAHWAVYDLTSGDLRFGRYWDYPSASSRMDPSLDFEKARERFAELFEDAVRIRLRSDVPVGLTLSGGLDSTAVLAAARRADYPLRCFTSVYGADSGSQGSGELNWARRAAAAADCPLVPVEASRSDWLSVMKDVVWHMDGPGYSPAVYPLWRLMQKARAESIPVLLEGQGADEELAGYPQYSALHLLDSFDQSGGLDLRGLALRLLQLRDTFGLKWLTLWILREKSSGLLKWHRNRSGFQSLIRSGVVLPDEPRHTVVSAPDRGRVDRRLREDHAFHILPGLLHYGDAISMAHSIETRHPFLDYRLVEWIFRAPMDVKLRDGETKWVLREYLRARGQREIGNRRDKRGYPTPAGAWLASEEGRYLESAVMRSGNPLHEWCEPARLANLFERQRRGAIAADHHLYKIISTQMWIDRCILSNG